MPDADTQRELRQFMHTLLARRIAAGYGEDADALRRALEDIWSDALVLRRWQRLALRLTEAQCESIVREAQRRGLAGPQVRWLPRALATEGWELESRGYIRPAAACTPRAAAHAAADRQSRTPDPIDLAVTAEAGRRHGSHREPVSAQTVG